MKATVRVLIAALALVVAGAVAAPPAAAQPRTTQNVGAVVVVVVVGTDGTVRAWGNGDQGQLGNGEAATA
jgi:hypothetical protein